MGCSNPHPHCQVSMSGTAMAFLAGSMPTLRTELD